MNAETNHRRINHNFYRGLGRFLLYLSTKDIHLSGQENIPKEGPAIVVANHMGIVEGFTPYAFLPETPFSFTKAGNFKIPVLSALLRNSGAIPVERGEADLYALRSAVDVLVNQKGFIFTCPEGTRGRDADGNRTVLKQAKDGVIFMAQLAANRLHQPIPICPWAVWGGEDFLPEVDDKGPLAHRFMMHRGHAQVKAGEPYFVYPSQKRQTAKDRQTQIDEVMLRIRDMLPEKYHGFYRGK